MRTAVAGAPSRRPEWQVRLSRQARCGFSPHARMNRTRFIQWTEEPPGRFPGLTTTGATWLENEAYVSDVAGLNQTLRWGAAGPSIHNRPSLASGHQNCRFGYSFASRDSLGHRFLVRFVSIVRTSGKYHSCSDGLLHDPRDVPPTGFTRTTSFEGYRPPGQRGRRHLRCNGWFQPDSLYGRVGFHRDVGLSRSAIRVAATGSVEQLPTGAVRRGERRRLPDVREFAGRRPGRIFLRHQRLRQVGL